MPELYETIDHTADIGIRTSGRTLDEAFGNAAFAMFDILSDIRLVGKMESRDIWLEANDLEQLLVDWLSELLYMSEVERVLENPVMLMV